MHYGANGFISTTTHVLITVQSQTNRGNVGKGSIKIDAIDVTLVMYTSLVYIFIVLRLQ